MTSTRPYLQLWTVSKIIQVSSTPAVLARRRASIFAFCTMLFKSAFLWGAVWNFYSVIKSRNWIIVFFGEQSRFILFRIEMHVEAFFRLTVTWRRINFLISLVRCFQSLCVNLKLKLLLIYRKHSLFVYWYEVAKRKGNLLQVKFSFHFVLKEWG